MIDRFLKAWSRLETVLIGLLVLCALFTFMGGAVVRVLAPQHAVDWADEVALYFIVWASIIAGSVLAAEGRHINTEIVTGALPARWQKAAAIFTFALIHKRVDPKDVAAILRAVPQPDLVTCIAFAKDEDDVASVNFILDNISARMANNLRDEAREAGPVKTAEGEEAMAIIMRFVRDMVANGDLTLLDPEDQSGD